MEEKKEITPEESRENRESLSRLEIFGLVTGVIGLVADTIGLVTFLAGTWGFDNGDGATMPVYVMFIITTGLLVVYGWLILAWIVTSRTLKRFSEGPDRGDLEEKSARSTAGIGLALIPLAIIWSITAFSANGTSTQPSTFATPKATVVTPDEVDSLSSPTPDSPVSPQQGAGSGVVVAESIFFTFFLFPLVGLGIFGCLNLLMPLVYGDLISGEGSTFDNEELRERVKAGRDVVRARMGESWADWEKRISLELSRNNWIELTDIQDMADLLDVPEGSLQIVFAKYASIHPTEVRYGLLFSSDGWVISEGMVLVNSGYDLGDRYIG